MCVHIGNVHIDVYICMCSTYIYIYTHTCIHIYIYIYMNRGLELKSGSYLEGVTLTTVMSLRSADPKDNNTYNRSLDTTHVKQIILLLLIIIIMIIIMIIMIIIIIRSVDPKDLSMESSADNSPPFINCNRYLSLYIYIYTCMYIYIYMCVYVCMLLLYICL